MKYLLRLLPFLSAVLFVSCQLNVKEKETVLDNISHVEKKIHYDIPQIPRLCDELKLVKKYINIGDCNIYYETEGEGIPIVLINGGPGGTHHYFHPWFSKLKKRHKIIYYDQRGTGQSDLKKGNGYSFEQAVDDLDKIRQGLGISKWIVCGYSYGGGLAQRYMLKYPENILGMVLISSLPMLPNENFESNQEKYISEEEKEMKKRIIKEYIDGKLAFKPFLYNLAMNGDWKRQSFHKPTSDEMIRSALYEWINDKEFNETMSESYSKFNLEGLFSNCPIPTLIFEGMQDLTWGNTKANVFKRNHPNAKIINFANAGHNLFVDETTDFFSELLEFTSNLQPISELLISKWKELK